VSVCKAVRNLGADAYLKWPNDVLYKGKKFCGILSEAVIKENLFKGLVIGVGINIEQKNIVSEKPFTTLAEMGLKVSKSVLVESIISNFEKMQKQDFISEFKKLCPTLNKEIVVDGKKGIFEDIDSAGRMILKTPKGREIIIAGDVQF
ncbi:MAG: biotin--[acetyl-CoA-carboxylase] ligase, partial [Elusimicrobiaceae bacterium]|nr:biotin--[acetyl-CoA-carboxylase] ligase [Elusimicrobiaceae bacterium]